jgi:hypothetical protein
MKLRRAAQIAFVIFCTSSMAPLTRNQEFARRDGNWWRGIDRVSKGYYLAGIVDGIELGNKLSVNGIHKNESGYKDISERVATSFSNQRTKYLANVTLIQLSDRLDAFYTDSENGSILLHDGVWLVLNQIAGTPEHEMQAMIKSYRKSAATE